MQRRTTPPWRASGVRTLLLCALALASAAAHAATITVDSTQDGALGCTLRGAIENVNAQGQTNTGCAAATGNDVIAVPAGTITLDSSKGPLVIKRSATVQGAGAGSTRVQGGNVAKAGVRVFDVDAAGITVTFSNLAVRNGNAKPDGRAMSNAGGLFVAAGAAVHLSGVLFEDNWAESSGGAIENRGMLTVQNTTFRGNQARGEGGAIRNIGQLQVQGSAFDSNQAERGGAIWVSAATGNVPIVNTSFTGNQAMGVGGGTVFYGGALMNAEESGATLSLTDNTYSANAAGGGNGNVVWEGNPAVAVGATTPIMAGGSASLAAAVQGSYVLPTGQVTLRSGVNVIGACSALGLTEATPATVPPTGAVHCAATGLATGLHSITASYSGDNNHGTGVSPAVGQIVNGYTRTDSTSVTVTGPAGATVWVDGTQRATLGVSGVATILLATAAPDGDKTFILQTRSEGTLLTSGTLRLTRDTVKPAWSAMQPANAGYLRIGSTLDYTLSENAASASITLTRTGGSADPAAHVCTLQGAALQAGPHQIGLGAAPGGCAGAQALVEGAIYDLSFVAADAAGNVSVSTVVTGITYDTQPPVFSAVVPVANGYLKADSALGYTLSETAASASIVATRTAGAADGTLHTCTLQGTALAAGAQQVALAAAVNGCAQALALVDAAVYTLTLTATDLAGNASAPLHISGITFDTTPPTAGLVLPAYSTSRTVAAGLSGSDGGSGLADYCLQVSSMPGNCAWTGVAPTSFTFGADGLHTLHGFVRDRAGNVSAVQSASVTVDTAVPLAPTLPATPAWVTGNSIALEVHGEPGARVWVDGADTGQVLDGAGKATITLNTSAMAEGASRTFRITLRDAAGNISGHLDLPLSRDGSPPAFSALQPAANGYLKAGSMLGYGLSENAASASITFARSGGSSDPAAPHTCTLQGAALQAGARTVPLNADADGCAVALALVDGAVYTLAYSATDAAGNTSAAVQTAGVMYDSAAPAAHLVLPAYSIHRTVSLTLSGSDGGSGVADYCLHTVNDASGCNWVSAAPASFTVGADGVHTLHGFVRDHAGNVSQAASASVDVDTGVPNPPSLTTTPSWATGNTMTVEVRGEPGARVWVDGVDTGQVLDGLGKASIPLDTSTVPEGASRTFRITLRDAAGNISGYLDLPLGRDGTPPAFSALAPLAGGYLKADSLVGYALSEGVARASITFLRTGGRLDAGAPHTCVLQGAALHAGPHSVARTADANGCVASLALADGAVYTLQWSATDAAGNDAAPAQATGITYDTTPPAPPVVSSPANGGAGVGSSVTVVGTAEDGSRVQVHEGAVLLAQAVAGGGSFSIQVQGLAYGAHQFAVTAVDAAGNVSTAQPLAYTAAAPALPPAPPGPPAPPAVGGGAVTVPPGGGVTVNGPAQVTAGPGSTVTLTPQSGGATIVVPVGTGAPVSVVIGGQTFSVQPQQGAALTLSVVTLTGADGRTQVALVLNPSPAGASRVTLGGNVTAGTVVGMLRTDQGPVALTSVGNGPVSLVLEAGQAGVPAPSWEVFVSRGQVALAAAPGVPALTFMAGEVAHLDASGHLLGARLGTAAGGGLGDAVAGSGLPAGVVEHFGYVRLDGVPARWGGSETVEARVQSLLQAIGIPAAPAAPDGTMRWTIGAEPVSVVPLEIRVAGGRADGLSVAADGSIEVVSNGLMVRFGPAMRDLPALARDLAALGGTVQVTANGGLRANVGGMVFPLRPGWVPLGSLGHAPGFALFPPAGLMHTGNDGISHALLGDVGHRDELNQTLSHALGQAVAVQTDLNMVTSVTVGGQRFRLTPDILLLPPSTGPAGAPWWLEGMRLFVRYRDGTVQAFELAAE